MKPTLVVGDVMAEVHLSGLSAHPRRGHEVFLSGASMQMGGWGARFAAALTRLGRQVTLIGKVGRDELGRQLRGRTELAEDPKRATGVRIALSEGEEPSVMTYPGATAGLTLKDLGKIDWRRYAHLHVASPFLMPGLALPTLLRKAKAARLTVSVSEGSDPAGRGDLSGASKQIDVLFTGAKAKDQAALVVVAKGEKGATASTAGREWKHKGFAGGAVFDAAFIDGWLEGHRVHEVLAYAAAASSLSEETGGGMDATPTRSEALHLVGRLNEERNRS